MYIVLGYAFVTPDLPFAQDVLLPWLFFKLALFCVFVGSTFVAPDKLKAAEFDAFLVLFGGKVKLLYAVSLIKLLTLLLSPFFLIHDCLLKSRFIFCDKVVSAKVPSANGTFISFFSFFPDFFRVSYVNSVVFCLSLGHFEILGFVRC